MKIYLIFIVLLFILSIPVTSSKVLPTQEAMADTLITVVPAVVDTVEIVTIPVTITAYSSTVDQCDDDPFITASNKRVERGVIALSRNLLKKFDAEAPFDWGHEIYIIIDGDSLGPFIVEDAMNKRYKDYVDIWHPTREEANNWGVKKGLLIF
jgi:3D (Asp-Asp-Asp) domain-containing protein